MSGIEASHERMKRKKRWEYGKKLTRIPYVDFVRLEEGLDGVEELLVQVRAIVQDDDGIESTTTHSLLQRQV